MPLNVHPLGFGALIVTPTYNERHNLAIHIANLRQVAPGADILVVDDHSPDGTGTLADELASKDRHVLVRHRASKLGLGTAYCEALLWGLAQNYTQFFTMDADLSHDARYLPSFFQTLAAGAEVVVGSRNIPGGRVEGWGPGRRLLSKGGSLYARHILGLPVRDMTSGFKAFTRYALQRIDLQSIRSNGYSFLIETTYRAMEANLPLTEVPIVFVDRKTGQSKMDRRIFAEAVGMVWRLRVDTVLKKYRKTR